jgi:MFS family permease
MSKKQFASLSICSLVPWTVGSGLLPLLPVYANQLGANSAIAGYYLAFSHFATTLGALSAGWVSDRLRRRKLPLIIAGLINIPICWLLGQVQTIWGLMAFTALLWFLGGLALALISILAGLSSGENERGKIFGILALTMGLGTLLGGLGVGWLVNRWGYSIMFTILAVFMTVLPLIAILLEEKDVKQPQVENTHDQKLPGLGKLFVIYSQPIVFNNRLFCCADSFNCDE